MLKTCKKCNIIYENTTDNFYLSKECKNGLSNVCKSCCKLRQAEYANKNKDHIKAYMKTYCVEYKKKNAARIAKYLKEWHERNIDERHKKHRINRINAREHIREYHYNYCRINRDVYKERRQKRRAFEAGLKSTFTKQQWEFAKNYFGERCAYCGEDKKLQQNHFISIMKGGNYSSDNIIPSCQRCNVSKSNKDYFTWFRKQSYFSELRNLKIIQYIILIKEENENERINDMGKSRNNGRGGRGYVADRTIYQAVASKV